MQPARPLAVLVLLSAASLVAVALAVATLLLAIEVLSPSEFWDRSGAFRAGLYATIILGAGPSLLLGAPGYWLLWRAHHASWLTVLPMGAVLGSVVGIIELPLIAWGIGCGVLVAGLTHLAARRWLGPNNLSKPKPLRG